jgi:YYY domain-containing protein
VNTSGCIELVVWLVVVQALAFSVLPFIAWMCPAAPDRGYGLSKVLGTFLFSATVWLSSLAGLTRDDNKLVYAIFGVILLLGYRGYASRWLAISEARSLVGRYGRSVEGLFLGLTILFGLIRFLNPEIFWGEKPMDSTFLNFFVRNQSLPPQDPWAAGSPMSYYYLGIYVIAALLKFTGIAPAIGYNLAMATLAGWIGAALFSLCLLLTKSKRFSFYAVWILLLASNPEVLRLAIHNVIIGREFNFDSTFWPSTRVFTSPSFLEYTSWSLLFADLHAHVIAIPFTVTAIALAAIVFLDDTSRYSAHGIALRLVLGAVVGALFGLNTWDFISFGGVVGVLLLCAYVRPFWKAPQNSDGTPRLGEVVLVTLFSRGVALVWDLAFFSLSTAMVVWLYQQGVSFRPAGGWGWVATPEFNTSLKIVRVIGYWLVGILVPVLIVGVCQYARGVTVSVPRLLGGVVLFTLVLLPGAFSMSRGFYLQPWGIFTYCAIVVSCAFIFLWRNQAKREHSVLAVFIISAATLIVVLEIFFLLDRMNTLFKGYMAVWMLSGVSSVVGAYAAYCALSEMNRTKLLKVARYSAYTVVVLLLLGTSINVYAIVKLKRVPKRVYTLDGLAFLREMQPKDPGVAEWSSRAINSDDVAAIDWFKSNIKGTPIIVEAQGDGYREFTRITMHTGTPTVMGWEHHARQRGLSHEGALERRKAIQAIYTSEDREQVKKLLVAHNVDFVIVGRIERNTYRRLNQSTFDSSPDIFSKVAQFGETAIYVTYFSKYNQAYLSENHR